MKILAPYGGEPGTLFNPTKCMLVWPYIQEQYMMQIKPSQATIWKCTICHVKLTEPTNMCGDPTIQVSLYEISLRAVGSTVGFCTNYM